MGQAKRRGTFEQRQALAVQRKQVERAELDRMYKQREREAQAKWAAMTPQEQAKVFPSWLRHWAERIDNVKVTD